MSINDEPFLGDREALKYARRDLATLDKAIARCRRRSVAVQAGGNLGVFPAHLSPVFQSVYSFEPSPALFRKMLVNAPQPNIVYFQAALGASRGGVRMSRSRRDGKPNVHDGVTHVAGPGPVPTILIDDLELGTCDLMVLDLEGMELPALQGARATIERSRPVVMVEVTEKNCSQYGLHEDDTRTFMRLMGYHLAERIHSDEVYVPR